MRVLQRIGVALDLFGGRARMKRFREGWASQQSHETRFHRTAKTQFRYRERPGPSPDAPTIVFTADPPSTLEFYDELFEVFCPHFRVVVLEFPAMGFSATTSGFGFGFYETNDEVAAFLKDVVRTPAILAFSCVTTLAALDIADRFPDVVHSLVLIQGGSVEAFARWKDARDPNKILAKPVIGQLIMKKVAPKRLNDWYELSVGRTEMVQPFCRCASETFDHGALWPLASAFQTYMDPKIKLPISHKPTLLLWGSADRSHPDGNWELCIAANPDAASVILPELGHAPEVEHPQSVLTEILARSELL